MTNTTVLHGRDVKGENYIGFRIPTMYKKRQKCIGLLEVVSYRRTLYDEYENLLPKVYKGESQLFMARHAAEEKTQRLGRQVLYPQAPKWLEKLRDRITEIETEFSGQPVFLWEFEYVKRDHQIKLLYHTNSLKEWNRPILEDNWEKQPRPRDDFVQKMKGRRDFSLADESTRKGLLRRKSFRNLVKNDLSYRILMDL